MRHEHDDTQQSYPGATTAVTQTTTWVGGWISPIIVVAFTLIWSFLIYELIGDRPRRWQYGTIPYVPGQSLLSSQNLPSGPVPRQVELPK